MRHFRLSACLIVCLVVAGAMAACDGNSSSSSSNGGSHAGGDAGSSAGGDGGNGGGSFSGPTSGPGGASMTGFNVQPVDAQVITVVAGTETPTVGYAATLDGSAVSCRLGRRPR